MSNTGIIAENIKRLADERDARRKTWRYRLTASAYEYGRRLQHVQYFIPELLGLGIAATAIVFTERC